MKRSAVSALALLFGTFAACTLPTSGSAPDRPTDGAGGVAATTSTSGATGGGGSFTGEMSSTGTSSGGTGTTGTTTSGTAGGSTTTGGGVEADCSNGVDDDGDGLADCADDDCTAGYTCVPAIGGDVAYVSLVAKGDACAAGSDAHDVVACTGCVCNADGGTCSVKLDAYGQAGCAAGDFLGTLTDSCFDNNDGHRWAIGTATHDGNASCTPKAATAASTLTSACAASAIGACPSAGQACVPKQGTKSCVLLPEGAVSCPAEYPDSHGLVFDDDGTGQCDCACSLAATTCNGAKIGVSHDKNNCTSDVDKFAADGTCKDLGTAHSVFAQSSPGQSTCESDAAPTNPTAGHLLCCQ